MEKKLHIPRSCPKSGLELTPVEKGSVLLNLHYAQKEFIEKLKFRFDLHLN